MKVRALYSYTAAESDETSFTGDDTLVECAYIDADWMLGQNPKRVQKGLLPSNYVEIIDWEWIYSFSLFSFMWGFALFLIEISL